MSTRGGKSKSSGGSRSGKKGSYGKGYQSKRPVGGAGIFVTCVRGKEGASVGQMYDLLEETAERHWPPERLAKFEEIRLQKRAAFAAAQAASQPQSGIEEKNSTTKDADMDDEEEEDEDESIEASIARELAELKAAKTARKGGGNGKGKEKEDKEKVKPRFLSLETGAECLLFFALSWPYDPVEMTNHIVNDLLSGVASRTKYIQRLEPISNTCPALQQDVILLLSTGIISKAFHEYAAEHNTTSFTFAIEPMIRNHSDPIKRDWILTMIGDCVKSLATPQKQVAGESSRTSVPAPSVALSPAPTSTSTEDEEGEAALLPPLQITANLKSPDLIILATVLKNVYGLGVVDGKSWKGKGRKFNLEQIGVEANKGRGEEGEGVVESARRKNEESGKKMEVEVGVAEGDKAET